MTYDWIKSFLKITIEDRAIYGNLENKINTLYWSVEDSIPKTNDMFSFKYSYNKVAASIFCLMFFVHSF